MRDTATPEKESRAWIAVLATLVILFFGMNWAAGHDTHWRNSQNTVDERHGTGLLLLAGFVAALPCLVMLVLERRGKRRWLIAFSVFAILTGGAAELLVAVAPDPWFTF